MNYIRSPWTTRRTPYDSYTSSRSRRSSSISSNSNSGSSSINSNYSNKSRELEQQFKISRQQNQKKKQNKIKELKDEILQLENKLKIIVGNADKNNVLNNYEITNAYVVQLQKELPNVLAGNTFTTPISYWSDIISNNQKFLMFVNAMYHSDVEEMLRKRNQKTPVRVFLENLLRKGIPCKNSNKMEANKYFANLKRNVDDLQRTRNKTPEQNKKYREKLEEYLILAKQQKQEAQLQSRVKSLAEELKKLKEKEVLKSSEKQRLEDILDTAEMMINSLSSSYSSVKGIKNDINTTKNKKRFKTETVDDVIEVLDGWKAQLAKINSAIRKQGKTGLYKLSKKNGSNKQLTCSARIASARTVAVSGLLDKLKEKLNKMKNPQTPSYTYGQYSSQYNPRYRR